MARGLKTYVTSIGFFDLAVAAPSMKAALEAWGVRRNLFHQGLAWETDDPAIVKATMAKPGMVLKRAVGTKAPFREESELPTELPASGTRPAGPAKTSTKKNAQRLRRKARRQERPPSSNLKRRRRVVSVSAPARKPTAPSTRRPKPKRHGSVNAKQSGSRCKSKRRASGTNRRLPIFRINGPRWIAGPTRKKGDGPWRRSGWRISLKIFSRRADRT